MLAVFQLKHILQYHQRHLLYQLQRVPGWEIQDKRMQCVFKHRLCSLPAWLHVRWRDKLACHLSFWTILPRGHRYFLAVQHRWVLPSRINREHPLSIRILLQRHKHNFSLSCWNILPIRLYFTNYLCSWPDMSRQFIISLPVSVRILLSRFFHKDRMYADQLLPRVVNIPE
jgi:hypothetical protein